MATKEKDDVSAPIAVLFAFLAFALAAGGIGGLGGKDGGGGDGGDRPASSDPCEDEPAEHVVRTWITSKGIVRLRCGDDHEGWEHLRERGRLKGDRDNIIECLGRTLAEGTARPQGGAVNPQWRYVWRWGTGSGERAVVRVGKRTGNVITAAPGRGNTAEMWARCAGR